jgi:hypothetical protein
MCLNVMFSFLPFTHFYPAYFVIPYVFLVRGNPNVYLSTLFTHSKSTPDIDGISVKLLKFVSHEIAVPLSHIFNLSISLGIFPDKFKSARIVPVFKTGDHSLCDNY